MIDGGKVVLRVIALATSGVILGWLLSNHESRKSANMGSQASLEPDAKTLPPPLVTLASSDISGSQGADGAASAPASASPPGVTLAELEREYGDPTIARGAKLTIQRVLASTLDQSRYQVHAIICHEQNCQIFSNPQVPGAEADWPPIVEEILQELAKDSFRDPETGAELKPTLQSISRGRRKDAVTVTIIWLR